MRLGFASLAIAAMAAATLAATASPSAAAEGHGFDCAHGPDTYRVRGVADWDQLNIRSGPGAGHNIVGTIPYNGIGITCVGPCEGSWCRINWGGIVGWSSMRFLGE